MAIICISLIVFGLSTGFGAVKYATVAAKSATKKTNTQTVAKAVKTTTVEAATPVASLTGNVSADQEATPVYHRIKSGDTLGALAAKYGTTVGKLCEMNGISKTTVLKLGRSIRCK